MPTAIRNHPQYKSLSTFQSFKERQLLYFNNTIPISYRNLNEIVFNKKVTKQDLIDRGKLVHRLEISKSKIIILTATKNRLNYLEKLYHSIINQKALHDWIWLVVDNGTDEHVMKFLMELRDDRVLHVRYRELTGYAAPVRNFGLNIIHFALGRQPLNDKYLFIIDSDDKFSDNYSLYELVKTAQHKKNGVFIHGFSNCISDCGGTISKDNTLPRNLGLNNFPTLSKIYDEVDTGPHIHASIFPIKLLVNMRYPDDISFEDDTLNQKILLYAKKNNEKWYGIDYPIIDKLFHKDSMLSVNNRIGGEIYNRIEDIEFYGLRGLIIKRLKQLRDFYYSENL